MNELIPLSNPQPSALFVPGGLSQILAAIEQDARSIVLDVTTRKGREQIASVAAKVARSKTYLDGLGKDYVAELKRLPVQVDAERKAMRDRLDALRDEIRAPLTAWEAEEERKERATTDLVHAISAPVLMGTSSVAICDRLAEIQIIEMPAGISDAQAGRIVAAVEAATPMLTAALDAALKAEEQAAEVARLQREEQARRQREHEERIAREAEERGRAMAAAAAERDLAMRERKLQLDRLEVERAAAVRAAEIAKEAERRIQEAEEATRKAQAEAAEKDQQRSAAITEDHATYLAERPHAPYSPSRLPYLELCPGWVGDGADSEAAARGTAIGARLAAYVVDGVDPLAGVPEDWQEAIEAGMRHLDTIRGIWDGLTWTMEDQIATSVPGCSGYVDLLGRDPLLGDTVLVEIKTGRGTRAPAEHNRQLQALALGLLEEGAEAIQAYLIECDWDRVTEAIFDDPKPLKSAVKALVLNATHATAQDLKAGLQCRYCARREQCPVFADAPNQALEVLGERTLSPKDYAGSLSPEALGETLSRVKPVVELAVSYLDALKARCYTLIEAGAEVPGWRVRLMGGSRTWADEEAAARA
jgi:hypothetical protein